jgi:hypothetical protein
MAKNRLTELNEILFNQLHSLIEKGDKEIEKSRAVAGLAKEIVNSHKLVLDASKFAVNHGFIISNTGQQSTILDQFGIYKNHSSLAESTKPIIKEPEQSNTFGYKNTWVPSQKVKYILASGGLGLLAIRNNIEMLDSTWSMSDIELEILLEEMIDNGEVKKEIKKDRSFYSLAFL